MAMINHQRQVYIIIHKSCSYYSMMSMTIRVKFKISTEVVILSFKL